MLFRIALLEGNWKSFKDRELYGKSAYLW